jgi:hypothetical protein
VPEGIIGKLREAMGGEDLRLVEEGPQAGDNVRISTGVLNGLQAVVTRVMPSKQRVAVLIDFLGRQTAVELDRDFLGFPSEEEGHRMRVPLWPSAAHPTPAVG